jgi:signal transduction histidine kinase
MVAFAVVIVVLTAGMAVAIRRSNHVITELLDRVKSEEYEITLVERLRWSGELIVSAGRGYLISGDTAQLANLNLAGNELDRAVDELDTTELSPVGVMRVETVRVAATRFRAIQDRLLRERARDSLSDIADRFETELVPARQVLRSALDQLVGHKTALLETVYAQANERRARLGAWTYGLLTTLVCGSLAVAWVSASRLARTYRREADALGVARQALASRDELMGIVAHDLRNPLGAITMRAEHLERTSIDPTTREQAAAIDNIATRMGHIIKTMLDVTVIETGHLTVHEQPCEVGALVQEAFDMVSPIAASKRIVLAQRVPEPRLLVLADRERVFQVLSNLLENAIKFTPRDGHVTLSVARAGDVASFAVSDTGPGIASADIPLVFERYWQSNSRGTKGTGLGLYIAKGIIEAHGGRISVESTPGSGATFQFTLALQHDPAPS